MDFGLHLPSAQKGANATDILKVAKAADVTIRLAAEEPLGQGCGR